MPRYRARQSSGGNLQGIGTGMSGLGRGLGAIGRARQRRKASQQGEEARELDMAIGQQSLSDARAAATRAEEQHDRVMEEYRDRDELATIQYEQAQKQNELADQAIGAGEDADVTRDFAQRLKEEQYGANTSWDAWGHLDWRANAGEIPPGERVPIPVSKNSGWPWSAIINEHNYPNARKGWMVGGDPEQGQTGFIQLEMSDGETVDVNPYGQQMRFMSKISPETWDRWAERIEQGKTAGSSASAEGGISAGQQREINLLLAAAEDDAKRATDDYKRLNNELVEMQTAQAPTTVTPDDIAQKKQALVEAQQQMTAAQSTLNAQRSSLSRSVGAPQGTPGARGGRSGRRVEVRGAPQAPPRGPTGPARPPQSGIGPQTQAPPGAAMDRQAAQLDQTMTGIGGAPTPYEARYGQAERRGMFGTPEAAGGAGGASAPVTPTTTAFDTNGDRTLNAGELSQRNAAYRNAKMILADWEQIKSDPAASGRFVNKQWPSIGGFPAGPLTEEKRLYLETLVREVESLVKKAGKTEAASLVPTGMRPAPQPNGGGLPA